MDNYNDDFFTDNAQEQIPLPYKVKPKRKKSPYESSDYVTAFEEPAAPVVTYELPPLPPEPKKKKRSAWKFWKVFISAVLIITLVVGCCAVTAWWVDHRWSEKYESLASGMDSKIQSMQQQQLQEQNSQYDPGLVAPTQDALTPGQVYAQNVRAVVSITNYGLTYSYGQSAQTVSSGSGFIITEDGYVVSNYHVVEGASELTVTTSDGTEYEAQLVGYDSNNDISLLKIDVESLPYVTIGSSDDLMVGDQVVAIGNALGELSSTLTVGYISAKDRIVTTEGTTLNMLQTDAAINAGNSGGPLLNMKGEVIGITTAKFSGTSESGASIEGIGFAIPIDDVVGMLEDIKDFGYVTGAYLGVMVRDVDETAQSYGLPAGAYVEEVTEGYAAERAGLQAQDIIIDLGGHKVQNVTELTRALRKFDAGETISITVYRKGQEIELSITLDEKPVDTTTQEQEQQQQQQQYQDPQTQTPDQGGSFWDYLDPFGFINPFMP